MESKILRTTVINTLDVVSNIFKNEKALILIEQTVFMQVGP